MPSNPNVTYYDQIEINDETQDEYQIISPFYKSCILDSSSSSMGRILYSLYHGDGNPLNQDYLERLVSIIYFPFDLLDYFHLSQSNWQQILTLYGDSSLYGYFDITNFEYYMTTMKDGGEFSGTNLERRYKNYLDGDGFTTYELYLPYCDTTININPEMFYTNTDANGVPIDMEILLAYQIDFTNGQIMWFIYDANYNFITSVVGQIGTIIPFYSSNATEVARNLETAKISSMINILSSGVGGNSFGNWSVKTLKKKRGSGQDTKYLNTPFKRIDEMGSDISNAWNDIGSGKFDYRYSNKNINGLLNYRSVQYPFMKVTRPKVNEVAQDNYNLTSYYTIVGYPSNKNTSFTYYLTDNSNYQTTGRIWIDDVNIIQFITNQYPPTSEEIEMLKQILTSSEGIRLNNIDSRH